MRLINTATLEFEEFFRAETPKYAILSHRWETPETQEVLYGELHTPSARRKKGYAKILDFCDVARSQRYDYAWVDTCCIHKRDNNELAEAVNSMFKWYKNSSICVTYLSDFTLRPGLTDEQFERDLAKSQWFRRGWTLQELIAPAEVEFYDSKWRCFGTKRDLARVISRITGISKALLRGDRTLNSFSCAQKMSWAANRRTTRPEDRSYSLLGLFNISIPFIYYGDGSMAFKRLQEEIIKNNTDQSIFAWVQQVSSPFIRNKRTICNEKCSILAPAPECFQFSSRIVPYQIKERDNPYTLTNSGLDITQPIRRVVASGDEVLLEVLLNCVDEDTPDKRISIAVMASKPFFDLLSNWSPEKGIPPTLPVSRVEPCYLGPVTLASGLRSTSPRASQGAMFEEVHLQISPISVDLEQAWMEDDVSWMNDPHWERETLKEMDSVRRRIEDLYDRAYYKMLEDKNKNKKIMKKALIGVGIGLFGAYALTSRLRAKEKSDYDSEGSDGDSLDEL